MVEPISRGTGTREQWLGRAIEMMRPEFGDAGAPLPENLAVSCSWPSGNPRTVIGECWVAEASSRGYVEVFISPVLDQVAGIQGVLVTLRHELVHAAGRRGHGKAFKALAVELGQQRPVDEVRQVGAGDGRRHGTGQPELHRERLELLPMASPPGRVHQLVAQRDQHTLDARDLVQHGADEDLDIATAGGLGHPALADDRPWVAAGPAAGNRQVLGEGGASVRELRPHHLDRPPEPLLSRFRASVDGLGHPL
jgi:hypothetical protein